MEWQVPVFGKTSAIFFTAALVTAPAFGQDDADSPDALEEILVFGRATDLVGAADSASEGLVGYDDLTTRPLLRVGELVEVIPGMIATQHSGGGKANQYFLRGMNLDHGTDFSLQFEGMPVNMRSHAHGQGYLDMNFIIPELVRTIDYRKGTYSADVGDFSAASSSRFTTYDKLDAGFVQATWGSEEYLRLVSANSWDLSDGTLLLGGEIRRSDGPWENPEDVKLFNALMKYTANWSGRKVTLVGSYYTNEWNATDQIPQRAYLAGDIGRYGFVDPGVGGETHRLNLIGKLEGESADYEAFISNYGLNLFGNPTYFLNDPVNGDEIEQEDERWIIGGRADHSRDLRLSGRPVTLSMGADLRYDLITDVNLFLTSARNRLAAVREDEVNEFSIGAYLDAAFSWNDKLRTSVGIRLDHFAWDVTALRPENSGSGSDVIVNPKLSVAYSINDDWEVYANYGGGFHSNDVRAAELSVDPMTGLPAAPFAAIVEADGVETGFRAHWSEGLNFSVTLFQLELDSELIFVGDAGTTEPKGATERTGVEAALFWQARDWLVIDLSAAKTDAKFRDAPPGQDSIPDAHDTVGSFGATIALESGFVGSLRVRHFGDAPLLEDGSVHKDGTTLVNLGLTYPLGDWDIGLDVLNLLDSDGNDIEYYYQSRLQVEPLPVEDFHFHPVEPREFRVRLRYRF